jgi:hypothetical protein
MHEGLQSYHTNKDRVAERLSGLCEYYCAALRVNDKKVAMQLLSVALAESKRLGVPSERVRVLFKCSKRQITLANKIINSQYPGAAATTSTTTTSKQRRKVTSDEMLTDLVNFFMDPSIGRAAEANSVNLRYDTLLELTVNAAALYRLYLADLTIKEKKIGETLFTSMVNYKNHFKVQTSQTAACGTCAQHGYTTLETIESLTTIINGAIEVMEENVYGPSKQRQERGHARAKDIRSAVNTTRNQIFAGYTKGCLPDAIRSDNTGASTTYTHCRSFGTSDVLTKEFSANCSHIKDPPKNVVDSRTQDEAEVAWGAADGSIKQLPDSLFNSRTRPSSPAPNESDFCSQELYVYNQRKLREDPAKTIKPLSRPRVLIRCPTCKRGFRRKSLLGAEFEWCDPRRGVGSSKITFQTLADPLYCRPCFSTAASSTHRMDCASCNQCFWLVEKLDLQVDYFESICTKPEEYIETIRVWRYMLQAAKNSFNIMLSHKLATLQEDCALDKMVQEMPLECCVVKRDYASKLKTKIYQETICGGGPAGIATDHIYQIIYKILVERAVPVSGSAIALATQEVETRSFFFHLFSDDTKTVRS